MRSTPDPLNPPRQRLLATLLPMLRQLMQLHGIDLDALLREGGLTASASPSAESHVDIEPLDRALRAALPRITDPAFGLKVARCWHPGHLGVLGHAWLASSTLRSAGQSLVRYFRVVGERGRFEAEDVPTGLKLRYWAGRGDPAQDGVAAVTIDMALALLLDMCRLVAGASLRPVSASLRRALPQDPQPWELFFGCAVAFGAPENTIVLTPADADRLLPTANRQLALTLDKLLAEQLARLDRGDVVARCRAGVLQRLHDGPPAANDIAADMHMSTRTLQRKLADNGIRYQDLLDSTRRDLALRYVVEGGRSMTDISFTLGFAGQSSFTRAFKRWTGASPSDYRQQG